MDSFEEFKKSEQYSSLLNIFNSVVYNQRINTPMRNTAYIYCNLKLPEYDMNPKRKVFNCDTQFNVNNLDIVQGTVMFYSKNQYLGCYDDISNILYLIDITDDKIGLLDEIVKVIHSTIEERIQEIKKGLKVHSQYKLMFADTIYDLDPRRVDDLSFIDRILNRLPPGYMRDTDGTIYRMCITDEHDIGLDSYKADIAAKAQKIIANYRQKYYDDTSNFRNSYKKMMEQNTPIPHFPPNEVIKCGLMTSVEDGNILYMFKVDIKVYSVVSENREKYVKLSKPVEFNDGLLVIKSTVSGSVIDAKFIHKRHHYHTDDKHNICLGSAHDKISNMRISCLNDLLKLKSSIINMMSVCNISSMFKGSYHGDQMVKLLDKAIDNSEAKNIEDMIIDSGYSAR